MVRLPQNKYSNLPPELRQVHWRVDEVKEDIEKETTERKEADKVMFEKFDKLNSMIIYQLGAAILTLVIIVAMFIVK